MSSDKIIGQKAAKLIEKLQDKTESGEVKWGVTTSDSVFQTSFLNYSIRIKQIHYQPEDPYDDGITYALEIYDNKGRLIEDINPGDLSEYLPQAFTVFQRTFILARRIGFNVEDIFDKLIDTLDEKKADF